MARRINGWKLLLVSSVFAVAAPALSHQAFAAKSSHSASSHGGFGSHFVAAANHVGSKHGYSKNAKSAKSRYSRYAGSSGLQCVPFARAASGIELKGNAVNWWYAAAGVYARGEHPEAGSVLNFRGTGRMRLGHVAVVTNVVGAREIEIDHANWAGPGASKGGVSRGIRVQDVSDANDWSQVRVALGHTGDFGSVYPTYGFIYDRPDDGTMVASASRAPAYDEVAEAPVATTTKHHLVHRAAYHGSKSTYH